MFKHNQFIKIIFYIFSLFLLSNEFLLTSQAKIKTKLESDNFLNEYCIEIVNAIKEAYETQIIALEDNDLKKFEKSLNKRFGMHFLSCSIARLVLQSPFMTKRLLKIASVDKNTINFVVELLFDEARLTVKETFSLAFKFILPFKTLRFFTKSPAFSL